MPYLLEDLTIDRVDLVDAGANSEAFVELYKRKENFQTMSYEEIIGKMKPDHVEVLQAHEAQAVEVAKQELSTEVANLTASLDEQTKLAKTSKDEVNTLKAELDALEADKDKDENEDVLKSMSPAAQEYVARLTSQKEAAEQEIAKAKEAEVTATAVAKAATLKSLPVAQETLVEVLKGCDEAVLDILTSAANALDTAVLIEVGKSGSAAGSTGENAWEDIEKAAEDVAKRDNVTKQKAISTVIKEQPELYSAYLKGGN